MRATKRKRPRRKQLLTGSEGLDLGDAASRAAYVGSSEHKRHPSFAGPPKLRADASRCDPTLADQGELTRWLRRAMRQGAAGAPVEGDFPRYVWVVRADQAYEARLTNRGLGEYKGYPIRADELPEELR